MREIVRAARLHEKRVSSATDDDRRSFARWRAIRLEVSARLPDSAEAPRLLGYVNEIAGKQFAALQRVIRPVPRSFADARVVARPHANHAARLPQLRLLARCCSSAIGDAQHSEIRSPRLVRGRGASPQRQFHVAPGILAAQVKITCSLNIGIPRNRYIAVEQDAAFAAHDQPHTGVACDGAIHRHRASVVVVFAGESCLSAAWPGQMQRPDVVGGLRLAALRSDVAPAVEFDRALDRIA